MKMRWVQHYTGKGLKWRVLFANKDSWTVETSPTNSENWVLPKSEYHICPPPALPDVWVDVTRECVLKINSLNQQQIWHGDVCIDGSSNYRFNRIKNNGAFTVERRTP